jgi:hypothetical protein
VKLQQPPGSVAGQVLSPSVVKLEDEDMGTVRVCLRRCGIVLVFVVTGAFLCLRRLVRCVLDGARRGKKKAGV